MALGVIQLSLTLTPSLMPFWLTPAMGECTLRIFKQQSLQVVFMCLESNFVSLSVEYFKMYLTLACHVITPVVSPFFQLPILGATRSRGPSYRPRRLQVASGTGHPTRLDP